MSGVLNVTAIRQDCSKAFQSFAALFTCARLSASEEDAEPYVRRWKNMAASLCASWLMSPSDTRRDNKYRLLPSQLR